MTEAMVCPECGSHQIFKDGIRHSANGDVQRFFCRSCGRRFRDQTTLKTIPDNYESSQQNVPSGGMKLVALAENTTNAGKVKTQKISPEAQIVNYLIHMKNNGRRDSTIESRNSQLNRLVQLAADLNDPESDKKAIASLDKSESYKALLCIAYDGFAQKNGITWNRPSYKQCDKLPFVPHEAEIDALISGYGKKTATFLKLCKETALRPGEAWLTEWIDFDLVNRTLVCKNPEKNSRSRAFDDLSPQLCQMIASLPHNSQYIFTCSRTPVQNEDRRAPATLETPKSAARKTKTPHSLETQKPKNRKDFLL
jgi:integrase